MAKIAVLFEQTATSTCEKNLLKTPGWDRINQQSRKVVLWASSIDSIDPQVDPTKEFSDLLQCKSAGAAHQLVLDYFDANSRGKYVSLSAGLTSALWACILRGNSPGTPENLSVFFVPRRSPADQAAVINHLQNHLKTIDGTGLDAVDIKLATKQKIILPADLQEYIHQISNFSPSCQRVLKKSLPIPSSMRQNTKTDNCPANISFQNSSVSLIEEFNRSWTVQF